MDEIGPVRDLSPTSILSGQFWFYMEVFIYTGMLVAAKTGLKYLMIKFRHRSTYWKIFEGEMFIRNQITTSLQIFFQFMPYFQI